MKFFLKKKNPLEILLLLHCLHQVLMFFSKCVWDLSQQWGLWENIEKPVQKAKIVIIAQNQFTLETYL